VQARPAPLVVEDPTGYAAEGEKEVGEVGVAMRRVVLYALARGRDVVLVAPEPT